MLPPTTSIDSPLRNFRGCAPGIGATQYFRDGLQQNPKVKTLRPPPRTLEIQPAAILGRQSIAARHLPKSRHTGLRAQNLPWHPDHRSAAIPAGSPGGTLPVTSRPAVRGTTAEARLSNAACRIAQDGWRLCDRQGPSTPAQPHRQSAPARRCRASGPSGLDTATSF